MHRYPIHSIHASLPQTTISVTPPQEPKEDILFSRHWELKLRQSEYHGGSGECLFDQVEVYLAQSTKNMFFLVVNAIIATLNTRPHRSQHYLKLSKKHA